MVMLSESETNKRQREQLSPVRRVAIIGAGYAGLSLANLLLSCSSKKDDAKNSRMDVVLIEALHPPTPGALVGNVRVPNAKLIFQRLGWSWGDEQRQNVNRVDSRGETNGNEPSLASTGSSSSIVSEDKLIQALRRPVESKIWHRHVCFKVEAAANDNNQLSLLLKNRETKSSFRYLHAIDVLIICTGASSKSRLHIPSSLNSCCCILVLGDARASIDVLGQRRIRQGANQAMQDAMDVSDMLKKGGTMSWGRFCLRAKRRAMMQVRVCFVFMVAFLAWLVRYQNIVR